VKYRTPTPLALPTSPPTTHTVLTSHREPSRTTCWCCSITMRGDHQAPTLSKQSATQVQVLYEMIPFRPLRYLFLLLRYLFSLLYTLHLLSVDRYVARIEVVLSRRKRTTNTTSASATYETEIVGQGLPLAQPPPHNTTFAHPCLRKTRLGCSLTSSLTSSK
jgi:hypothetical protein